MAKKKVLLVDDEKSLTSLLKLNLEETGDYDVRVENWPEDAIKAAREFKPDIILLDIIMPRMPGGNVAAAIDTDPELKGTPIVFLTAAVTRKVVDDHDGIIAEHPCLPKPASIEQVVAMIEKHIRQ